MVDPGAHGGGRSGQAPNGEDSYLRNADLSIDFTAVGGGGGGGGSQNASAGGAGEAGQGNDGGDGNNTGFDSGGGGGGAGGPGLPITHKSGAPVQIAPLCLYHNLYPRVFLGKLSHQFVLLYLWVIGGPGGNAGVSIAGIGGAGRPSSIINGTPVTYAVGGTGSVQSSGTTVSDENDNTGNGGTHLLINA